MLGEIAQFNPFRQPNFALQRSQFARQELDERGFTRAVSAQQTDARTWHQIQFDGVEDGFIAIACADFFHFQQRVRQTLRRTEAKVERVVHVRREDQLHPLQHFNAALSLFGFRRFSFKTVNKALQMGDALLLAFVHRLLLGETRGTLAFKRAVVAGVLEHRLLLDMNDFIDYRIEEIPVMGNQNQCALIAFQPFFQPDNRV